MNIRICIDWAGAQGNNDNPRLKLFRYNDDSDLVTISPTHLRQLLLDKPDEIKVEVSFGDGQETVDAIGIMDTLKGLRHMPETSPFVKARAYSDDQKVSEDFDAAKWFEQASDTEIRDLATCGWGGDYPADAVAQYMAEHDDKVGGIFTYLDILNRDKTESGFECHVDIDSAMAWLDTNRPNLAKEFRENEDIETEGSLPHFHMQ